MAKTVFSFLSTTIIAGVLFLSFPVDVSAKESNGSVVVLVPNDHNRSSARQLHLALKDHLSPLNVEVLALSIDKLPKRLPRQKRMAEKHLKTHNALSVVWISNDISRFYIFTPRVKNEPRSELLPSADEGIAARWEAPAAIVYSEVSPLASSMNTMPKIEAVLKEPVDAKAEKEEPSNDTRSKKASSDLGIDRVILFFGYAPTLISDEGPFFHTVALGAGLRLGKYLELNLGVDMFGRDTFKIAEYILRYNQWPVRLSATGILPFAKLDLGLKLGASINVWYVEGLSYNLSDSQAKGNHLKGAVIVAPFLRFRATKWIWLFLEVGADLFFKGDEFTLDNKTLLKKSPVVLRMAAGLEVAFGPF